MVKIKFLILNTETNAKLDLMKFIRVFQFSLYNNILFIITFTSIFFF